MVGKNCEIVQKNLQINYEVYTSETELNESDRFLLNKAKEAASQAYAPYSNFKVGAALKLENGVIILGNNQENIAYPSGLCAERVAVFAASANHAEVPVETIAITAQSANIRINHPVTPCGSCRQVLIEYEHRFQKKIRVILHGKEGEILIFNGVEDLLPFQFDFDELKG